MADRRAVTIKHVAAAAGVTPMTVSNVLNRKAGAATSKTIARVLEAVDQLGYRPHAVARGLRTRRLKAIGVLVLDDAPAYLSDPFSTNVIAGIGNVATENGYSLILQGVHLEELERAPLLLQVETAGVCALLSGSSSERQRLMKRLLDLRQPLVLFQETSASGDVCLVRQDDRGGAVRLARRVLDRGARRLMLLLPKVEWPAMIERELGFRHEARARRARLRVVRCDNEGIDATQAALAASLAAHGLPDAVLGGNDRMAIAALKLFAQRDIKVPDDVLVTGFNGFESVRYVAPELTTVVSPAYELGRRGGLEILTRVETGRFSQSEIVLPVHFMPGASA